MKKHRTVYRKEYMPPPYRVETIDLCFQIYDLTTIVKATTRFVANPDYLEKDRHLILNGSAMELVQVKKDGHILKEESGDFVKTENSLEINNVGDSFCLEITTGLTPSSNLSLEGLYRSSGNYCTQCEPEGFRKITYSLDRPDVLARYTTRIEADQKKCPILLAGGNLVDQGLLENSRHYAVWQDPFPKPSYLFALVAGDLVCIEDEFVTASDRKILLQIYVEGRNIKKCDHAMLSLKHAMKWDEKIYGLEYDLDRYMIVAVDDFNMGAMENKGLNIFNSKYVLATPETATDMDYVNIEGVIGHEYFHNWTGNRVTCRDWFQLSLKEGLTVFRDQQFSADMHSKPVQRIKNVQVLRNFQFKEDSGPMAHPVRPDSYVEINNFYTMTVYNKGAELIRMIHTLIGPEKFRRGMDIYFERFDGKAVTCEDFVAAMEKGAGKDLKQFRNWYRYPGTPTIEVKESWQPNKKCYTITVTQSTPGLSKSQQKKLFHIPIRIGLLNSNGEDIEYCGEKDGKKMTHTDILELTKESEQILFKNLTRKPTLSFLRDFSAPVQVKTFQTREELAFLMKYDSDLFNRWDSSRVLAESVIFEVVSKIQEKKELSLDPLFIDAFRANLTDHADDKALLSLALGLPAQTYLAQQMEVIDPDSLHQAVRFVRKEIGVLLRDLLVEIYCENNDTDFSLNAERVGRRCLKNRCLYYLTSLENEDNVVLDLCKDQYYNSTNMTDREAALGLIANSNMFFRTEIVDDFYERYHHDPLVVDKWFTIQASSERYDCLENVKKLMNHPGFSIKNPNKVRSLIGSFASMNHFRFHDESGEGYRFLAEQVISLDQINQQIAARLVMPMTSWKRYDANRQDEMRHNLERILHSHELSRDVYEIVNKSLKCAVP